VHAYKGKWKDYWERSIFNQHTCHLPSVKKSHRNRTSHYFRKETIASTWQYKIYGFRIVGSFTEAANPVIYIPDPRIARVKRERRQTRRIRNDMDESELHTRI
jgi:hypothetical protein